MGFGPAAAVLPPSLPHCSTLLLKHSWVARSLGRQVRVWTPRFRGAGSCKGDNQPCFVRGDATVGASRGARSNAQEGGKGTVDASPLRVTHSEGIKADDRPISEWI